METSQFDQYNAMKGLTDLSVKNVLMPDVVMYVWLIFLG